MRITPPQCPSGDASAEHAVAFGVVGVSSSAPLVRYFAKVIPIAELSDRGWSRDDIEHGIRVASPCAEQRCGHFDDDGSFCRLAGSVRQNVPAAVDTPPPCEIRRHCVWWAQEGTEVCRRCPVVVRRQA